MSKKLDINYRIPKQLHNSCVNNNLEKWECFSCEMFCKENQSSLRVTEDLMILQCLKNICKRVEFDWLLKYLYSERYTHSFIIFYGYLANYIISENCFSPSLLKVRFLFHFYQSNHFGFIVHHEIAGCHYKMAAPSESKPRLRTTRNSMITKFQI